MKISANQANPFFPTQQNEMDPLEVMEWLEENNDILASLQTSISLIIRRRKKEWPKRGGSRFGQIEIYRNCLLGHQQLNRNYFSENPTYPDHLFHQCFRTQQSLCFKISKAVIQEDDYFVQKRDAAGQLSFSPLQEVTLASRFLAYGCSSDSIDE
jgi:hypothetical protein